MMGKICPFSDKEVSHMYCVECDSKICGDDYFFILIQSLDESMSYEEFEAALNKKLEGHEKFVIVLPDDKRNILREFSERYSRYVVCIPDKTQEYMKKRKDWISIHLIKE